MKSLRTFLVTLLVVTLLAGWTRGNAVLQFAANGDPQPLTDYPTAGAALYDSVGNSTWVCWKGYNGATDSVYVRVFNHTTGTWGTASLVNSNPIGNDNDGGCGIVMDQYGYVHILYGAHNTNAYYSVTAAPRNPASWTTGNQFNCCGANGFTYFSPVLINGVIWVLSTSQPTGNQDIIVFNGTPASNGTPISAWSTPVQITNFTGSKVWAGNLVITSGNICFPFTNHVSGAQSEGIYYGCYHTSTGAFSDITGGTSIPSGSLPFSVATAISDFQVVAWPGGTSATVTPAQTLDANGVTHVLYSTGNHGSNIQTLSEAYFSAGAWTTGVAIGGSASSETLQPTMAPKANGVQVFWGQSTNYPTTIDNAYSALSTTLGVWAAPVEFLGNSGTYSLSMFSTVTNDNSPNNPTPFPVVFSEQNQVGASGTNLQVFAYTR